MHLCRSKVLLPFAFCLLTFVSAGAQSLPSEPISFGDGRVVVGGDVAVSVGRDNPLIGYPLAYQYLTSLRPDALPANADELLRMRARGWLSNFSIGNRTPDRGLPLISALRWDTGVQVTTGWRGLSLTGAVTNG